MAAADAGADLLQSLRLERKTTPEATAVLLHGEDGNVRVHRMLASLLSPVLRRIVSPVAGIHQPERLEYLLPHHTVALLDFALDFCCGDPLRIITAENALPLLALADELCLETLRTACEKHLIEDCLVSTNAEQLRVEAERYNAHALLAAVQNAQRAETGRLTQLSLERSSVYTKLAAAERERADKLSLVELLSRKLNMVEMKRAHELEQLFQKKSSRPPQGSLGRDFPHADGEVVYVWPNCSAPRFTHDGIDLEWIDEEADRENERALVARLALDEPPPPDPAGVGAAAPNEEASGSQTGKAAAAQPSGHGGAAVAPAPPAGTDPLTDPLPKRFGSIMEAVEAVVPGSVIKLLAGRHLVSQFDRTGVKRWPNFTLRKSVQITGHDGLSREDVVLGISSAEQDMIELGAVLTIERADVRLSRLTFPCAVGFGSGAAFAKLETKARLWIEDCEVSSASSTPNLKCINLLDEASAGNKMIERGLRESVLGVGVSVCKGTSLNVRNCFFCGTSGAAIQIAPNAKKVQLHGSIFTNCGRGTWEVDVYGYGRSPSIPWVIAGECGAIELEDPRMMDEDLRDMDKDAAVEELANMPIRVWVTVRDCDIQANFGPGVSVRPHCDVHGHSATPEAKKLALQLIRRFELKRCKIKGNELAPGVAIAKRKRGVVWNRTPRGEGFAQVEENFVSESEYTDEYESEEYDTDGYSDEDEEEALTDDDAASAYTQFLLYGYGYHHGR